MEVYCDLVEVSYMDRKLLWSRLGVNTSWRSEQDP
jgi:hypothetical protein